MKDPNPKIVVCAVCGRRMAIPPGYENVAGKCRGCGAEINAAAEINPLEIDIEPARPHKRTPAPVAQQEPWIRAARAGLLWGLAGALVAGVIAGAIVFALNKNVRELRPILAIVNTGGLVGFIVCSTFVVVRRLSAGPLKGLVIGAGISLAAGIFSYMLEWYCISPSDRTVLETAATSLMGGAVVGIVCASFLNRE